MHTQSREVHLEVRGLQVLLVAQSLPIDDHDEVVGLGHRRPAAGRTLGDMERASLTRLRWRLRGAWQWPTFLALLVVNAVLLSELPLVDSDFAAGLLLEERESVL